MCQELHHSLLHASVGECSLACIYYNEVETLHTASQNPTKSSWNMQHQLSGKKGEIMTLVLWHTASNRRGKNKTKSKLQLPVQSVGCAAALSRLISLLLFSRNRKRTLKNLLPVLQKAQPSYQLSYKKKIEVL